MFTPLRGRKIGRRAVVIGFVLAGATATAAGNPIWQGAPPRSLRRRVDPVLRLTQLIAGSGKLGA